MKIALSLGFSLICLSLLTACPPQTISQIVNIQPSASPIASPTAEPTAQAVIQVVHDNANALNGNDETRFMATLHPNSQYRQLQGFYERLHTTLRTRYNILETKIQSQSGDIATVFVKRRTSDISGTVEQDVLYTMRTDSDQQWKIFDLVIQSMRYI